MQGMEGQSLVLQHAIALLDSMVLKCSVKLRLFDAIHGYGGERRISLSDLAASLSVLPNREFHLRRILRYLSHMHLVTIHREAAPDTDEAEETYALTPAASAHLRDASENSLADVARYLSNEEVLSAMHMLDTCLVGEMLPIERARGETLFEWMGRDPALNRTFQDAMTCTARQMAEAVVRGCPEVFEGVKSLVDVGGGRGIMASAVAKAFPNIKCVVYDFPHAMAQQTPDKGVAYQVGDMFVSLPRAEALLLMRVMHCWNDEKAIEILKRCREAIAGEKRKIIIVDTVIDENESVDVQHIKLGFDIWMMAYVGGKERTEKEWRSLLLHAGFTHCTFNRVKALETVIEASP